MEGFLNCLVVQGYKWYGKRGCMYGRCGGRERCTGQQETAGVAEGGGDGQGGAVGCLVGQGDGPRYREEGKVLVWLRTIDRWFI